jgi:hypothetical protein
MLGVLFKGCKKIMEIMPSDRSKFCGQENANFANIYIRRNPTKVCEAQMAIEPSQPQST